MCLAEFLKGLCQCTTGIMLVYCLQVYRGLWQGTEVAIKTMILPSNMSGAEKREKMVGLSHACFFHVLSLKKYLDPK